MSIHLFYLLFILSTVLQSRTQLIAVIGSEKIIEVATINTIKKNILTIDIVQNMLITITLV